MGPDGPAVVNSEPGPVQHPTDCFAARGQEAQFPGNDFFREVALADEERHHKDPGGEHLAKRSREHRMFLPECRHHLGEDPALSKGIRLNVGGPRRIGIQRGAMPHENERRIGKLLHHVRAHCPGFAPTQAIAPRVAPQ